ncbi:hypothetical protein [Chryseosolibacter indicus]|uniref:Uncharacterized protein n=1 Tax=Chryseosolibacter indicus TaxID=2782351 RepID=A0ABS5VU83_9BACT|nr:hypothetical protein [Chryseosolibacter indicus]MBT1704444.1 hypothetical protein [Chryseosolibacter indicus]
MSSRQQEQQSQTYQHELAESSKAILLRYNDDYKVKIDWRAFQDFNIYRYSPEVDIAIGPFNDDYAPYNLMPVYTNIVYNDSNLISFLKDV